MGHIRRAGVSVSVETPLKHGSRGEIFRRFAERRLYLHLSQYFFESVVF